MQRMGKRIKLKEREGQEGPKQQSPKLRLVPPEQPRPLQGLTFLSWPSSERHGLQGTGLGRGSWTFLCFLCLPPDHPGRCRSKKKSQGNAWLQSTLAQQGNSGFLRN